MSAMLEVRGLVVRAGSVPVVRGVDLAVDAGETLGIIGESGSGKTVTCLAVLRLLPPALAATADAIRYRGQDIAGLDDQGFQPLRGRELAMVFQDPVGAFNPAKRIGWHLRTVMRRRGMEGDWRPAALGLLEEVGISQPAAVLERYPHQLSGGMLQRVLIAMVLALEPGLVVADEPTTNLDNIVERQILALFQRLRRRMGSAFLFITHDIGVAAHVSDRLMVMYAGEVVESGPADAVLSAPLHPYTQGLVATARALMQHSGPLAEIPGQLPAPGDLPPGCAFQPRCSQSRPACGQVQGLRRFGAREVRCLLHD
jgi:oligopeptide/dipeptide ABC transporter ATP-binding protein